MIEWCHQNFLQWGKPTYRVGRYPIWDILACGGPQYGAKVCFEHFGVTTWIIGSAGRVVTEYDESTSKNELCFVDMRSG